jgi:hypothetical protein
METFSYPVDCSIVHVALFVNVVDSSLLRSRIIKASAIEGEQGILEREAVNFAFINARLVSIRSSFSLLLLPTSCLEQGHKSSASPNGYLPSYSCRYSWRLANQDCPLRSSVGVESY